MSVFDDPDLVASYAEGAPRKVPGYAALLQMAELLLAEKVPDDGNLLILGAGGGLETKAFAEARPGWRFCGVDPSGEMLALARRTLGPLAARADLIEGCIEDAPRGPFDGATCLLTLHFLPEEERRRTVAELVRRLKPGAPLVVAHHSISEADAGTWLARSVAFAAASGAHSGSLEQSVAMMKERLPFLPPERDEAILRDAGVSDVALFYAGFTFRGWVSYKV